MPKLLKVIRSLDVAALLMVAGGIGLILVGAAWVGAISTACGFAALFVLVRLERRLRFANRNANPSY